MAKKNLAKRAWREAKGVLGFDDPPDDEPIEDAKKEHLSKQTKIATAEDAMWAHDMLNVAGHQRAMIKRAQDKKFFGNGKDLKQGETYPEEQDLLVAEDIRTTNTTINRNGGLIPTLGAMAVGAALLWGATQYLQKDDPTPEQPEQPPPVTTDLDYEVDSRIIPPE